MDFFGLSEIKSPQGRKSGVEMPKRKVIDDSPVIPKQTEMPVGSG